jgi:hypothetical protein
MEIRLQDNNTFIDADCFACGTRFTLGPVAAVAYGPASSDPMDYARLGPVELGDICEECLMAGTEQLGIRLGNRAEELRESAAYLERLADGPIQVPSMAEWRGRVMQANMRIHSDLNEHE